MSKILSSGAFDIIILFRFLVLFKFNSACCFNGLFLQVVDGIFNRLCTGNCFNSNWFKTIHVKDILEFLTTYPKGHFHLKWQQNAFLHYNMKQMKMNCSSFFSFNSSHCAIICIQDGFFVFFFFNITFYCKKKSFE
jgi:hypothetical protein